MRTLLAGAVGLVLANAVAASQYSTPTMEIKITPSQVTGAEATVPVMRREMYIDNRPFAWIQAPPPLQGTPVPGLSFGVRAWAEGEIARVVVYAVLDDKRAADGRTQTAIASVLIAAGQSVEVSETERWGASRVFLKAVGH